MCRSCKGKYPTAAEYYALRNDAKKLFEYWVGNGNAATNSRFVSDAVILDNRRLKYDENWGSPGHRGVPQNLIFNNSDPNQGLLLYILCNWLDYQRGTAWVWSTGLKESSAWLPVYNSKNPPRAGMLGLDAHLRKTVDTSKVAGSISQWFADNIIAIATHHPKQPGNIYRIAGLLFHDLLQPANRKQNTDGKTLRSGQVALLGDWKRLWVLLRSLRRNNGIVRCLFERALKTVSQGQQAADYWYDDSYFDPNECQLPVDRRVKQNWIAIMKLSDNTRRRDVALDAMKLASAHNVSPSVFDILFLA